MTLSGANDGALSGSETPATAAMAKRARSKWRSIDAAIEAIVGLFVAVVVALAVFSTSFDQPGTDLSQRLLLWMRASGGALGVGSNHTSQGLRPPPDRWVFVDLAEKFCDMDGERRCPPGRLTTDRAALASLLHAVREQKPRVVVLDVLTERLPRAKNAASASGASGDDALHQELIRPGRPVLLAWHPTTFRKPGIPTELNANDQALLLPLDGPTYPSARYFPSLKRLTGADARRLEPSFIVGLGQTVVRVPGLAFAAALVARAPSDDAPWELVDRFDKSVAATSCDVVQPTLCKDYLRVERVFSFPARRPDDDAVLNLADRVPTFARLDMAPGDRVNRLVENAVVVIGDSRQVAGDWTWSAIGNISGSELILNDIRQYSESPASLTPNVFVRVLEEWPFFVVGALGIFAAHRMVNGGLRGRHEIRGRRWLHILALRRGLTSAAELLLATVFCSILFGALLATLHHHPGRPLDFVTPFVGILIERVFDLVHRITSFLHAILHELFLPGEHA